jgi:uncharacterized delta-60 repeat protein
LRQRSSKRWFAAVAVSAGVAAGLVPTVGAGPATAGERATPPLALDAGFGTAGVASVPQSAAEADRFLGVAIDGGHFYAAGFTTTGGDQAMSVTKLDARGRPDPSFGTNGTASVNVAVGGKTVELARGVVVQPDGKVVIGGPVEHDPKAAGDAARDTDVALVRFDEQGQLDPTYGTGGIARFDLSTGYAVPPTTFRGDTAWGIAALPGNRVVVSGGVPSQTAGRTDLDYAVFAVDKSGRQDMKFAGDGLLTYDRNGSADSARWIKVAPDGMIVASGYSGDATGAVTPIILRFDAKGKLDKTFGDDGALPATRFLDAVSESYSIGFQGDKIIFAGYGSDAPADKVDLYSVRLTKTGKWDKTYGNDGVARVDLAADEDRARDVTITKQGHVVAVGSTKPTPTDLSGLVMGFDANGKRLEAFGTEGASMHDFGGPNDSLWGVAPTNDGGVVVVGYKGAATGGNDDSVVLRFTGRG